MSIKNLKHCRFEFLHCKKAIFFEKLKKKTKTQLISQLSIKNSAQITKPERNLRSVVPLSSPHFKYPGQARSIFCLKITKDKDSIIVIPFLLPISNPQNKTE